MKELLKLNHLIFCDNGRGEGWDVKNMNKFPENFFNNIFSSFL